MKRWRSLLALTVLAALGCSSDAIADKRIALVVGNANYAKVPSLPTAARDAAAIAQLLLDAGLADVKLHQDLSNLEFKRTLRRFFDAAWDADIAVVYVAGHGIEVDGTGYLVPVDAVLTKPSDAQDEAVSLRRIVEALEGARFGLIIYDACRESVFPAVTPKPGRSAAKALSASAIGEIPANQLAAAACKTGPVAAKEDGERSAFTAALLKHLTAPGLDVRLALGRVRDEVLRSTDNRQAPYVDGTLGDSTFVLAEKVTSKPSEPAPPGNRRDALDAEQLWRVRPMTEPLRCDSVVAADCFRYFFDRR